MAPLAQAGTELVAAGYVMYSSSTIMVLSLGRTATRQEHQRRKVLTCCGPYLSTTSGTGVYGFTLDPTVGEFLLSHDKITIPDVRR